MSDLRSTTGGNGSGPGQEYGLRRLSLNQATVPQWTLPEAVDGCAAAGIGGIGLWREPVAEAGLDRAARLTRDAGVAVTSLCRGGFFTAADPRLRARARDDNRRAVDEAAALGTDVLVLVSGGLPAEGPSVRDVDDARQRVIDAVAELAPYAAAAGVRLALEPLHPMFCSDRCVIVRLDQALDVIDTIDTMDSGDDTSPADALGVVVDAYHVWWDPSVYAHIARAGRRICSFQVCDWVTPLPAGVLTGRGMVGDGCIELRRMREAVDAAGYTGPIEVEIFNDRLRGLPGKQVAELTARRYLEHVA